MWFYVNGNLSDSKINLSSPWSTTVNFVEGYNDLRIVAEDVAGNIYQADYEDIWVDTTPLQITYTNLDEISPAYTIFETIKGTVNKPRAKIIVMVNNKTSSGKEIFSTSIYDLIQSIAKGDIKYDTVADDSGNFSVEIRLEQEPKLFVTEKQQQTASSLTNYVIDVNTGQYWLNHIKIFAIDENELYNATVEKYVLYTKCGKVGQWSIDGPLMITPTSLPESYFRQGFAQVSYNFKLKWKGGEIPQKDVSIYSIRITKRGDVDRREMYKLERELMVQNPIIFPMTPSPMTETYYVTQTFAPLTSELEKSHDWFSVKKLNFPVQIEIEYGYRDINGNPKGPFKQISCWDIPVEIEQTNTEKLAGSFLKDITKWFDAQVKNIDNVLSWLQPISKYTMLGCFGLIVLYIPLNFVQGLSCMGLNSQEIADMCRTDENGNGIIKEGISTYGKTKDEIKACCKAKADIIKNQALLNSVCDRVFCPSVPSLWYHTITYHNDIVKKYEAGKSDSECAGIEWVKLKDCDQDDQCKKCKSEFMIAWQSAFLIDWPFGSEFDVAKKQAAGKPPQESGLEQLPAPGDFTGLLCNEANSDKDKIFWPIGTPDGTENSWVYIVKSNGDVFLGQCVKYDKNKRECYPSIESSVKLTLNEEGGCVGESCNQLRTRSLPLIVPPVVNAARKSISTDKYVLNPTAGVIASGSAVCLPAIIGYLKTWRNIMSMSSSCFKSITETGKGTPGSCEETFSIVICDLALDALSCAMNAFKGIGYGSVSPQADVFGIGQLSQYISSNFESMSNNIAGRYGTTNAYQVLFNERKLIHSICNFAFTHEMDFNVFSDMLSEPFTIPTKSTCSIPVSDRRFMGFNAANLGRASYLYHGAVQLFAGADLSYDIELVCSSSNDCKYESNPGGRCDCSYGRGEQTYVVKSGSLKQGEVLDEAIYQPMQDYDFRYDKIRLTYRWTNQNGEVVTNKCEKSMSEVASPYAFCSLSIPAGVFRCSVDIGDLGIAYFLDEPSALREGGQLKVYQVGDYLLVSSTIEVKSPEGKQQTKLLGYEIMNDRGMKIFSSKDSGFFVLDEGIKTYQSWPVVGGSPIKITTEMFGAQVKLPTVVKKSGGTVEISNVNYEETPTADETFAIIFIKNEDNNKVDKLKCVSFDEKSNKIGDGAQIKFSEGSTVRCKGVSFTITGTPIETKWDQTTNKYKSGDLFIIKKSRPEVAGCTGEKVVWNGIATLYYGKKENDKIVPAGIVVYNGQEQVKPFKLEVICGSAPREAVRSEGPSITNAKIIGADDKGEFKKDTDVTVTADIASVFTIKEIYLTVGNAKIDMQLASGITYYGTFKASETNKGEVNIFVVDTKGNKVGAYVGKVELKNQNQQSKNS